MASQEITRLVCCAVLGAIGVLTGCRGFDSGKTPMPSGETAELNDPAWAKTHHDQMRQVSHFETDEFPTESMRRAGHQFASLDESGFLHANFEQPSSSSHAVDPSSVEISQDQQPGTEIKWTLEQLEERALQSNPAIAELEAEIDAARGRWIQAGLPPNPILGYSGQQLFSDGMAEQHGVIVGQQFIRGDKLGFQQAIVSQEIALAEQRWQAQQLRVLTDVRLSYYEVLIAQLRIRMTKQLTEVAREAVSVAESLRTALEVSDLDVTRAQVELQATDLQLRNAQNIYDAAWRRLAVVLNEPNLPPVPLAGDVETELAAVQLDEAMNRLMAESPEISVAMLEIERSRARVDRAIAEVVPDVDVQAVIQSDNGTGSANANLQVTFPLPWRNQNQGAIREARADWAAASQAVDRIELNLRRRLNDVFQRYIMARDQVDGYARADGILDRMGTTLELVGKRYEASETDYVDLLTAQRLYSQTNLAYLESLGQMWSAYVEIEGLLLKNGLERGDRGVTNGASE